MSTIERLTAAMLVAGIVCWGGAARAMLNPDAVYCEALGYEYVSAHTSRGVIGVCKLPGGKLVNASSFYHGLVAEEFGYCATQGLEAGHDTTGKLCKGCQVCIQQDGTEVPVLTLMKLSFAESRCGDGHCGTAENTENCPSDCPSGRIDDLCDGLADGKCDPDCEDQGLFDPDCGQGAEGGSSSGCGCEAAGGTSAAGLWIVLIGLALGLRRRRRPR